MSASLDPSQANAAYAQQLRGQLANKMVRRSMASLEGELVLLLSNPDGSTSRLVVRTENGAVAVFPETAARPLPQAIVRTALEPWLELLQTGRLDLERVDLFGELSVLHSFLAIHRIQQRPLDLRCAMMSAGKTRVRERNHS